MLIEENRFRALCRKDLGGIEGAKFKEALDSSDADPVAVKFVVGVDEEKIVEIPRVDAILYAKIAEEERKPEEILLTYIKPEASMFIRYNRKKMVDMIKNAMLQSTSARPIVLIWPLWTPDSVPYDVAWDYVRRYEQW